MTTAIASQRLSAHQLKETLWSAEQLETQIAAPATRREAVHKMVGRVLVSQTELDVEVKLSAILAEDAASARRAPHRLKVSIELIRRNGETSVIVAGDSHHAIKTDPVLVKAIARGVTWFEQLAQVKAVPLARLPNVNALPIAISVE